MIYATATITLGQHQFQADLTEDGWKSGTPEIASTLNTIASPSQFGPADGNPMACAAERATKLLGAEVELMPVATAPPGTVY